jgi:hypothetical protein
MKVIENYKKTIENSDENLLNEVLFLESASRSRLDRALIIQ